MGVLWTLLGLFLLTFLAWALLVLYLDLSSNCSLKPWYFREYVTLPYFPIMNKILTIALLLVTAATLKEFGFNFTSFRLGPYLFVPQLCSLGQCNVSHRVGTSYILTEQIHEQIVQLLNQVVSNPSKSLYGHRAPWVSVVD